MPTAPTDIAAGPTVPDSSLDEPTFDAQYEDFYTWEKDDLQPGANALAANVYANALEAEADATTAAAAAVTAATQASAAAGSAASAVAAPGTQATSTTSLVIGAGSKSLSIQTGKAYSVGQGVVIADTSAPATNWMFGQITSYNSGTGALVVNVAATLGSGTIAAWTVSISANPSVVAPVIIGQGGRTITGNLTLTVTAGVIGDAAISVTPATPGLYVTLPVATTVSAEGVTQISIYNAGDYDYGVKDSAGTVLGWVRPRTGSIIGLADNSTAAGVWAPYGLEKTAVTASFSNATVANMAANIRRIALDANRTCLLFGGVDCYGVIYDASTQTWGTATLVRAGIASGAFTGVLSATNQVLVCSCDTTTGFQAVTLTIATNTITVNAQVSVVLGSNFQGPSLPMPFIAVGSSFVVGYWATGAEIRALTVSGTVPTIGAASALSGTWVGSPLSLFASGSIVRALSSDNSTLYVKPFTVSTSTLSAGTAASVTVTNFNRRAFINGNGNLVCQYANTTHYAAIFKLTGTVEAASSVSLGTAASTLLTSTDYLAVSASKIAFGWCSASTAMYCNILTDTAGTATAGTALTTTVTGNMTSAIALGVSGNTARFALFGTTAVSNQYQLAFDCSGASPTLSSLQHYIANAVQSGGGCFTPGTFYIPIASDLNGVRDKTSLISGASFFAITGGGAALNNTHMTPGGIYPAKSQFVLDSAGVAGANTNETWLFGSVASSAGANINRVECAA